jgi:hypothetical protein
VALRKLSKIQICKLLFETCTKVDNIVIYNWAKFQFFNETLIFDDFLKKKGRLIFVVQGRNPCPGEEWRKENREEQRGPEVFLLIFFPRNRIRSMRREKKHKNIIKNSPKISVSFKKFEALSNCRWLWHLPFVQVSNNNLQIWIFGNFLSATPFSMETYGGSANVSKLKIYYNLQVKCYSPYLKKTWVKPCYSLYKKFFLIFLCDNSNMSYREKRWHFGP